MISHLNVSVAYAKISRLARCTHIWSSRHTLKKILEETLHYSQKLPAVRRSPAGELFWLLLRHFLCWTPEPWFRCRCSPQWSFGSLGLVSQPTHLKLPSTADDAFIDHKNDLSCNVATGNVWFASFCWIWWCQWSPSCWLSSVSPWCKRGRTRPLKQEYIGACYDCFQPPDLSAIHKRLS